MTLIAAALAIASCSRTGSSGAAKQPQPAGASGGQTASPAASSSAPAAAGGPRAITLEPVPPSPAGSSARPDTGLFTLLAQGAQDGLLPEDFEIGPLASSRLLQGDGREAFAVAASLAVAFARGAVDRSLLAADSREALAGMLGYAIEQGELPASFRLGPPRAAGQEQVANLRLLGAEGSTEGEIYARLEGRAWLVSDLQVDPARMLVRKDRSGRTFFPSPYRWLLGG